MKQILILAVVLGFLAYAFHAPTSEGEYLNVAKKIAVDPPRTPFVFDIRLPTVEQVKIAFSQVVKEVSGFDLKIDDGRGNIVSTREVGGQVVQTVRSTDAAKLMNDTAALLKLRMTEAKDLSSLIKLEPSPTMRKQLQAIDWAVRKADTRECKQLLTGGDPAIAPVPNEPTTGDLLAYCIARVTNAKERCNQIADSLTLPLRSLCKREITLSAR